MQLAGPGVFGPPKDPDAAIAVLRAAVDLGIRHIDTADFYGPHVTNELIREALAPYPDDLHIVTKVGARRDSSGGWPHARTPAELREQVHDNLRHLGLDVLDVVNLRVGGIEAPEPGPIAEQFEALADLQQQGLIRHLGLSTVTAGQLAEAQSIAPVVCVQNLYNIARRGDDDLVDLTARQGIAFVPYFPLGGFLAAAVGRPAGGRGPARRDPDDRRARLAAAAVIQRPADPWHVVGGAPARERCRCCARAASRRSRRAGRDRPLRLAFAGRGYCLSHIRRLGRGFSPPGLFGPPGLSNSRRPCDVEV
jgi:aryl-alcohol dehydrogenase-like predicted oxidoreductase